MPVMAMVHDVDPKEELAQRIGHIEDIEVFNSRVLVAIYKRPEKTKSGLILADTTRDEDKYQGKVGLVLKMGPLAFKDDADNGIVFPNRVDVGDWVVFRVSDGFPCGINHREGDCRMVRDVDIKMKIQRPDSVY